MVPPDKDGGSVKIATDIGVALVDRVVGRLVNSVGFKTERGGLGQGLESTEPGMFNE